VDKLIGQRITTVEQGIEGVLEGVVVAVAHDHGEDWQLLVLKEDGSLVGVRSTAARVTKPEPGPGPSPRD